MPESEFSKLAKDASLQPQEAMLDVRPKKGKLFIGVPAEKSFQDNRVGLTPQAVSLLTNHGHKVVVETKAGEKSSFKDKSYSEAGAQIARDVKEVYAADIIIKVAPPTLKEIDLLHADQTIISPLHLPTIDHNYIQKLLSKKVTAIALEYIKDDSNTFPIVRSMSEIAGNASILIAAELLSNNSKGKGLLLGGIVGVPPAKVVILGAGMVGEHAAKAAMGLGAEVRVFDDSIYKLMRLQGYVGSRIYTSVINPEILTKELKTADVTIGAIHSELGRTPCVVTEEMVSHMNPGSVIVDVSIDQGGCFETSSVTTHDKPTFKQYDVIHYCVPNIPSRVSRTASYAISNTLTQVLIEANKHGGFDKYLKTNEPTRHGVYAYKGCLTNQYLSEKFHTKYTDLGLLFATRI